MNLPPSPFKGLAYFGDSEHDWRFFFGRERESELVAANLMASRLTVLYGPSGVGKSSLLRAGVARRLRALVPAADGDGDARRRGRDRRPLARRSGRGRRRGRAGAARRAARRRARRANAGRPGASCTSCSTRWRSTSSTTAATADRSRTSWRTC